MDKFVNEVLIYLEGNKYKDINYLSAALAVENFMSIRNYPKSYDEDMILKDMKANKAKIAMAAIEIDAKTGTEGQLSHSENGISRGYSDKIMAYNDVIGFSNVI